MPITIELSKYMFTPEFSEKIHTFSQNHHKEALREFRISWKSWISTPIIADAIEKEIATMQSHGYTGTREDVYKKMLISARFYYRKKSKKEAKTNTQDANKKCKAYIRLSYECINMMDTFIRQTILQMHNNNSDKIKINHTQLFDTFAREHKEEINRELGILKQRYETAETEFIPLDIANKFTKTFQNRIYITRNSLCHE